MKKKLWVRHFWIMGLVGICFVGLFSEWVRASMPFFANATTKHYFIEIHSQTSWIFEPGQEAREFYGWGNGRYAAWLARACPKIDRLIKRGLADRKLPLEKYDPAGGGGRDSRGSDESSPRREPSGTPERFGTVALILEPSGPKKKTSADWEDWGGLVRLRVRQPLTPEDKAWLTAGIVNIIEASRPPASEKRK